MAAYIVGTPSKTVTPSLSSIVNASEASNRGSRVRHAPVRTAVFSPQVWPNEWNRGSAPNMTSSWSTSSRFWVTSTFLARFKWVSSAPFGVPVVPDV